MADSAVSFENGSTEEDEPVLLCARCYSLQHYGYALALKLFSSRPASHQEPELNVALADNAGCRHSENHSTGWQLLAQNALCDGNAKELCWTPHVFLFPLYRNLKGEAHFT